MSSVKPLRNMAIYIALSTTLEHVSSSKFTKPSSNPRRITNTACGFEPGIVNYKKGCTRLAAAGDKVYQLLAHGRWFSSGTPAMI
jgi:hypothetical protein